MQRLESDKWSFKDKNSTIYSKHTRVPVWVVLMSQDVNKQSDLVYKLLDAQAKYMPRPSLFAGTAAEYLRSEGYRLPEDGDVMELSESVSLLLLQEIMNHFNSVCRVSDNPLKSYNNVDLVVKEEADYVRVVDYLVSCQDDITLSCMFDTQRSNTKVFFTVVSDMSVDFYETLRRMTSQLLLVTDSPKENLSFDDTLSVSDGVDTILENISNRII